MKYRDRGVQVLVVDVEEERQAAVEWAARQGFTMPVLLDGTAEVADRYAPDGIPKDIRGGWNLIIDREGVIRFFTVVDPTRFDAELIRFQRSLDELLAER